LPIGCLAHRSCGLWVVARSPQSLCPRSAGQAPDTPQKRHINFVEWPWAELWTGLRYMLRASRSPRAALYCVTRECASDAGSRRVEVGSVRRGLRCGRPVGQPSARRSGGHVRVHLAPVARCAVTVERVLFRCLLWRIIVSSALPLASSPLLLERSALGCSSQPRGGASQLGGQRCPQDDEGLPARRVRIRIVSRARVHLLHERSAPPREVF